jgi:predicted AAA+ superfamily ATPase
MAGRDSKGIENIAGEYNHVNPERLSPLDYRKHIEEKYSLLTGDELRKMVAEYNAKSPYERMFKMSTSDKIDHKVAVKILREKFGKHKA